MDAEEFVAAWRREKETLLRSFMGETGPSLVSGKIDSIGLTDAQRAQLRCAFDQALADTMYTLLLGLDGAASIGDLQHTYKICDEGGKAISECGQIEAEAWRQFHGNT